MNLATLQELTSKVNRLKAMADAEVMKHSRDVEAPPSPDLLRAVGYTQLCTDVLVILERERVQHLDGIRWLEVT